MQKTAKKIKVLGHGDRIAYELSEPVAYYDNLEDTYKWTKYVVLSTQYIGTWKWGTLAFPASPNGETINLLALEGFPVVSDVGQEETLIAAGYKIIKE